VLGDTILGAARDQRIHSGQYLRRHGRHAALLVPAREILDAGPVMRDLAAGRGADELGDT
jgi:hypothetical protein